VVVSVDGTKDDILNALRAIADNDMDFNGENGEDYLWAEAKQNGFISNVDYVMNEMRDFNNEEEMIEKFIEMWMGKDDYYQNFSVRVIRGKEDKISVISLAYTF